jgi:hypothetical protein
MIEPGLVNKMLHFFEDTRAQPDPERQEKLGWYRHGSFSHSTDKGVTTDAVLALAAINHMLDSHINTIILDHFTVKKEKDLQKIPELDQLFYPDYGLRLFPKLQSDSNALWQEETFKLSAPSEIQWPDISSLTRKESVAIALEKMHAHVSKVDRGLHSLVLHGPAGTGKTTLPESLALTCGVPLVEVTPSDIVVAGAEAIERRARTVFEALSLLTRVVILFDEFDPVLWRRNPNDSNPRTVFSFLTPGMLPKLKTLHDRTSKRSVAYILITNLIGGLDEAAVREGRFDEKIGIYPPDVLSRTGRLIDQCIVYRSKSKATSNPDPNRLFEIVKLAGGCSMQTLSKRGWFTAPEDELKGNTPFHYLFMDDSNKLTKPESEAELKLVEGEGKTAIKEYTLWWWVQDWDQRISSSLDTSSVDNALQNYAKNQKDFKDLMERLAKWINAKYPKKMNKLQFQHANGECSSPA